MIEPWSGSTLFKLILKSESKFSDLHGIICETNKLSTMKSGDCDFEIMHFGWAGSLGFNPQVKQAKSNMIVCTQSIKERF